MAVSKAPSPRPSPEHFDHLKWGAGTKTAMGAGSAVRISGLAVGQLYVITADAAWHFYQGPSASGAVSQATIEEGWGEPIKAPRKTRRKAAP